MTASTETKQERNARIAWANRLRRQLKVLGYYLERTRLRYEWAPEFGKYRITTMEGEIAYGITDQTHPGGFTLTLDEVEEILEHLKKVAR
jgi:hypothetical protein